MVVSQKALIKQHRHIQGTQIEVTILTTQPFYYQLLLFNALESTHFPFTHT